MLQPSSVESLSATLGGLQVVVAGQLRDALQSDEEVSSLSTCSGSSSSSSALYRRSEAYDGAERRPSVVTASIPENNPKQNEIQSHQKQQDAGKYVIVRADSLSNALEILQEAVVPQHQQEVVTSPPRGIPTSSSRRHSLPSRSTRTESKRRSIIHNRNAMRSSYRRHNVVDSGGMHHSVSGTTALSEKSDSDVIMEQPDAHSEHQRDIPKVSDRRARLPSPMHSPSGSRRWIHQKPRSHGPLSSDITFSGSDLVADMDDVDLGYYHKSKSRKHRHNRRYREHKDAENLIRALRHPEAFHAVSILLREQFSHLIKEHSRDSTGCSEQDCHHHSTRRRSRSRKGLIHSRQGSRDKYDRHSRNHSGGASYNPSHEAEHHRASSRDRSHSKVHSHHRVNSHQRNHHRRDQSSTHSRKERHRDNPSGHFQRGHRSSLGRYLLHLESGRRRHRSDDDQLMMTSSGDNGSWGTDESDEESSYITPAEERHGTFYRKHSRRNSRHTHFTRRH